LYSLLAAVNNDLDLPHFKRTTLYVLLKELVFVYEKRGNKAIVRFEVLTAVSMKIAVFWVVRQQSSKPL
jgi:hypothetical protein